MTALAADFPVPNDFMQPFGMLQSWVSDHRNARRVERDVAVLLSQLEFVSSLRVDIGVHAMKAFPADVEAKQSDALDSAMDVLEAMRTLHTALTSGLHVRRIRRDVERFTPHMKHRLNLTIASAADHIAEMRAVMAFFTGEDDDVQLGIELVPEAGEPMSPEDSHPPT